MSATASAVAAAVGIPAVASPVAAEKGKTEEDAAAKKQEAMNAAVARFKDISTSLGGHEQAKAFFDTYGTEGFKPQAEAETELVKPKDLTLDSDIKDHSDKKLKMAERPEGFGAKYIEDQPWDVEEPTVVSIASALNVEEWQELFDTTKMLHGYVLNGANGISRARFQAFQLKPRPGQTYTDSAGLKPDFEVFDASSISIKETKTQVERSMAQNGFSSEAISASVAVSTPYVGGGVSASYATDSQKSKASSDFSDRQEYTATYNFPRARVFLDELNLEVTAECAQYLVNIQNAANKIKDNIDRKAKADEGGAVTSANRLLQQFYSRFGHIFACTVQLGGQLTSTKSASSFASVKDEQKRDAMQAAVAVSVESKFVSASAGYSKGKTDENESRASNTDSSSALAWNARGGNTLLCANPAAWANSVADYQQWRVMEQENVLPLPELISRLERLTDGGALAWPGIAKTFLTVAQNEYNQIPPVPPGTWTGKLSFETLDGQKVIIKDGCLCVSAQGKAAVFHALDADMKRRDEADPQMAQLYADHPLFLLPDNRQIARRPQSEGGQFPGLWVDPQRTDNRILPDSNNVSRWSLRPGSVLPARNRMMSAAWTPNKIVLKDGDEVGLFNHSYYAGGSYTTVDKPPMFAPFAVKKSDEAAIRVWKLDPADFNPLTDDEVRLKPNWAWTSPDRASIQSLMELSDRGAPISPTEEAQIETYRKVFTLSGTNWLDEYDVFLDKIYRQLSVLNFKFTRATVGEEAWIKARQNVGGKLPEMFDGAVKEWAKANGFTQPPGSTEPKIEALRLRVRFVN
ncbi:Putative membrane attack complex component/perforin (MACPF) domain-containing protein [Septoria linicola]|uniref:Membrane attack complex component/perforin (MACPF) domain-containing protein n=1 Tax=Septoria linicola TaxID=215465 RepID=A0A9Q9B1K8_9PEZI|nr:Putative membrane attack complex component/perforin (MACPF) domain-containing protein [Septoria linicola]